MKSTDHLNATGHLSLTENEVSNQSLYRSNKSPMKSLHWAFNESSIREDPLYSVTPEGFHDKNELGERSPTTACWRTSHHQIIERYGVQTNQRHHETLIYCQKTLRKFHTELPVDDSHIR